MDSAPERLRNKDSRVSFFVTLSFSGCQIMTLAAILGAWFLISIPTSLLAGKFIAYGTGSDLEKQ